MVKKLLVPVEEGKNEHKKAQLRKLAEINGTLRDNMWQTSGRTWTSADVYCRHCGEISHTTSDCPLKGKPIDKGIIDAEYNSFMSAIGVSGDFGETPEQAQGKSKVEKSYEDFMSSLIGGPAKPATPAAAPMTPAAPRPWDKPVTPTRPPGATGAAAPPGIGFVPPRAPAPGTPTQAPMMPAQAASSPYGYPGMPSFPWMQYPMAGPQGMQAFGAPTGMAPPPLPGQRPSAGTQQQQQSPAQYPQGQYQQNRGW